MSHEARGARGAARAGAAPRRGTRPNISPPSRSPAAAPALALLALALALAPGARRAAAAALSSTAVDLLGALTGNGKLIDSTNLTDLVPSAVLAYGSSGAMFVAFSCIGSTAPCSGTAAYVYGGGNTYDAQSASFIALVDPIARWKIIGPGFGSPAHVTLTSSVTSLATAAPSTATWVLSVDFPLYAGGYFAGSELDVPNASYIAAWDGSEWSALGGGVKVAGSGSNGSFVAALAASGGFLYVGGRFESVSNVASGAVANTRNVARWSIASKQWLAVGTPDAAAGVASGAPVITWSAAHSSFVSSIALLASASPGAPPSVVFGGTTPDTSTSLGDSVNSGLGAIARWTPTTAAANDAAGAWSSLAFDGAAYAEMSAACLSQRSCGVLSLLAPAGTSGQLYATGSFTSAGGVAGADYVALWSLATGNWSRISWGATYPCSSPTAESCGGAVYSAALLGGELFTAWAGPAYPVALDLASSTTYNPLLFGALNNVTFLQAGPCVGGASTLIVGGKFSGTPNRLAKLDTTLLCPSATATASATASATGSASSSPSATASATQTATASATSSTSASARATASAAASGSALPSASETAASSATGLGSTTASATASRSAASSASAAVSPTASGSSTAAASPSVSASVTASASAAASPTSAGSASPIQSASASSAATSSSSASGSGPSSAAPTASASASASATASASPDVPVLALVTITITNVDPGALAAGGGAAAVALRYHIAGAVSDTVLASAYGGGGGSGGVVAPGEPFVVNATDAANGTLVFTSRARRVAQLPGRNASATVVVALHIASAAKAARLEAALSADAAAFGIALTSRLRAADPAALAAAIANLGAPGSAAGAGDGDAIVPSASAGAPLTVGEVSGVAVGAAAVGFGLAVLLLRQRRQRLHRQQDVLDEAAAAALAAASASAASKALSASALAAAAAVAAAAAAASSSAVASSSASAAGASAAAASALPPAADKEGRLSAIELDLAFLEAEGDVDAPGSTAAAQQRRLSAAASPTAATPRALQTPLRPRHLVLRQPAAAGAGAAGLLSPATTGAAGGALAFGGHAAAALLLVAAGDAAAADAAPAETTARRRARGSRSAREGRA